MKGFNYPAPAGAYKLTVTKGSGWQNHKTCRVQISLRNAKYEGDKFFAILEWAAARFERVICVLSDSLLKYNLVDEENISDKDAHKKAIIMGDDWLARNHEALSAFKNIEVLRWDDCLKEPDFTQHLNSLYQYYLYNDNFRAVCNDVSRGFLKRKNGGEAWATADSVIYLLEELAVFGCLFENDAVDVYAGTWVEGCIEAVICGGIIKSYSKAHWLEVDLVRNKAFKSA